MKALYPRTCMGTTSQSNLKNVHEVPALEKIVVSVGTGKKKDDKRHFEIVKNTVENYGQHQWLDEPNQSRHLEIRKGMGAPIGVSVTLRGARMYEFMSF